VMLGLILNHMALNMTDDYYDFRHLVDVFATDGKNPYTGGSGLLSSGLIHPQRMRQVFVTFYLIAIGIGVFLGVMRGPFILLLLALVFSVPIFTLPPPFDLGIEVLANWRSSSVLVQVLALELILSRPKGFPGRPSGEPFPLESCFLQ